ncbi:metal ABC transporter substrate-binding protein [Elusimicrobiota bacterium]
MKRILLFGLFLFIPFEVFAKLDVICATEDLADLTRIVGGSRVKVAGLSSGEQDLHFVEPRPSMVFKLKRTDMVVRIGMDLDMWMDSLIGASKNSDIVFGAKGYVDASVGLERLEVPEGKVDASMGDIHLYGNPHYWLDPMNAVVITDNILKGLIRLSPESSEEFRKNREEFLNTLKIKIASWEKRIKPYKGTKIMTYHNSWPYFAKRFGFIVIDHMEPRPGIPPTPSHIARLLKKIKKEDAKIILVEPYISPKGPNYLAQKTGIKVMVVPPSVGGAEGVETYVGLFDHLISRLAVELEKIK